jgi:cell division protein FtsQ
MIFRSNSAPRNRRLNKKKRSQNILDVKIRAHAAATQRNSKIMKWLCVFILIASACGGVYWGAREGLRRFVFENPDYALRSLEIVTDGALSREEVIATTGIREGANIFSINLAQAQRNLSKQPRVELAEITRTLPGKISINITERKPVAWVAAKNEEDPSTDPKSFLVDRRGTLISVKNFLPEYLHLPIIYGIPTDNLEAGETVDTFELRAALDLVRITSDSPRVQIRSIDLSKRYCMIATDRNRARITFALEKIDEQLDRLAAVMDHVESTKQEIQTVNLMVQRNIPVTFASANGAADSDSPAASETAAAPAKSPKDKAAQPKAAKPSSPTPGRNSEQDHAPKAERASKAKEKAAALWRNDAARDSAKTRSAGTKSTATKDTAKKPQPIIRRATPVNGNSTENMPIRKALPVNSADSPKHNG